MGGRYKIGGGEWKDTRGPKTSTTTTTAKPVRPTPKAGPGSGIEQYKPATLRETAPIPKQHRIEAETTSTTSRPTTTTTAPKTGADIIGGAIESANSRKRQLEELMKE